MYQTRTLKKLPPRTRKLARHLNDIEKGLRAFRAIMPDLASQERWERASVALAEKVDTPDPCPEHTIIRQTCEACMTYRDQMAKLELQTRAAKERGRIDGRDN